MATLREIWELSNVPLFDMDAPGFSEFARLDSFENDFNKIPGYMPCEKVMEYKDAQVDEISWHNCGIAVKFYKGDEDDEE